MDQGQRHEQFHDFTNSIRRVYNRLRSVSDQLHADCGISAAKRTLMMDLRRGGEQTVPALAASRFISRQIIQTQVNELKKAGLVELATNPEHKRSWLVRLTSDGEAFLDSLIEVEMAFMEGLGWLPDVGAIDQCKDFLDTIYERLEVDV